MPSLMGILFALAMIMAVFAKTSHSQIGAIVTIFVWGIAAFATVPPLQTRVVEKAKDAPNLASTLNIGAFNVGNAGGAWLGGAVLDARSRPRCAAVGRGGGRGRGARGDMVSPRGWSAPRH